ncbi:glycosyl transferase, family 2 [Prochlorococcus marinus str. MIT 9202]|nr:glycosyl transferase, family 2 [Prochlorococcus marinus str. MIT 9202]
MFKELKESHSNFFKISRKQYSKVKKNSVAERFNIASGEALDIIENNFTVDFDDIILEILELTISKKYPYLL